MLSTVIVLFPACDQGGVKYTDGVDFIAADGCNECECVQGVIQCTQNPCFAIGVTGTFFSLVADQTFS